MYQDRKGTILDRLCHEIEDEHNKRSRSPRSRVTEIGNFYRSHSLVSSHLRLPEALLDPYPPHSLKRLWNDQRNITAWFTTWAVIIIGGGTLVFQVLQCVFQIDQPLQNKSTLFNLRHFRRDSLFQVLQRAVREH
jgi:hypothetical protein